MSEPQVLQLNEYQMLKNIHLSRDISQGLRQKFGHVLEVNPTMEVDRYNLKGKSIVGVFKYNGTTVQIKPKVDIPTIWEWLSVAYDLKSLHFKDSNIGFEQTFGSLDWIVKFFIHECKIIYSKGIIKGYFTKEEAIQSIRGQWQPRETYNRWIKHDYQFDCRFDELTENVKENQFIAGTFRSMMSKRYPDSSVIKDCKELLSAFGKELTIAEINQKMSPARWVKELDSLPRTRLNAYYQNAFAWARMYWKATALAFEMGNHQSDSFLLDMNELFEMYIGKLLIRELKGSGVNVTLQKHDSLAEGGKIKLITDILVKSDSGKEIVIDTKYMVKKDNASINSNVFQMLAYLTARKTSDGILLYAGGPERSDLIKNSDFRIHQWSLNLDCSLDKDEIDSGIHSFIERLLLIIRE